MIEFGLDYMYAEISFTVSEDGKTYDVVDSDLKVVGKGVAKGSHSGWAGSSVLYTLQDGKIHFYSIK